MDLINLVYDTLSPLDVPVLWQSRPEDLPGITYYFFNEGGALYGDGDGVINSVSCQIDIWSRGDYTQLKEQVKSALKKAGFLFSRATDTYEKDVKIYHCVMVFNYYFRESEG